MPYSRPASTARLRLAAHAQQLLRLIEIDHAFLAREQRRSDIDLPGLLGESCINAGERVSREVHWNRQLRGKHLENSVRPPTLARGLQRLNVQSPRPFHGQVHLRIGARIQVTDGFMSAGTHRCTD